MTNSKKILIVQLYSNGDCLYATTIARQIKEDFPGCSITWAIAPFCRNIISNNPFVDEILLTEEVKKNDVAAFRRYKLKIEQQKQSGIWDEVFMIMNMDTNLALYDGSVRGMILRAYPGNITVSLQPVLNNTESEKNNVAAFAEKNKLKDFDHVILWEYAPQSGQAVLSFEMVMSAAKSITAASNTCIILSSANKFEGTAQIIDASILSVRENAALTHFCSLLIGCSSGITWLTTSSGAKFLPMLQLLNPDTDFINTTSEDFKRYNIQHAGLIEMTSFTPDKIHRCVMKILDEGFEKASVFHEKIPLQFNTTKKIVYNLMVYREFAAIRKHYRIMLSVYGRHPLFLSAFYGAIANFPLKLISNIVRKKILTR